MPHEGPFFVSDEEGYDIEADGNIDVFAFVMQVPSGYAFVACALLWGDGFGRQALFQACSGFDLDKHEGAAIARDDVGLSGGACPVPFDNLVPEHFEIPGGGILSPLADPLVMAILASSLSLAHAKLLPVRAMALEVDGMRESFQSGLMQLSIHDAR